MMKKTMKIEYIVKTKTDGIVTRFSDVDEANKYFESYKTHAVSSGPELIKRTVIEEVLYPDEHEDVCVWDIKSTFIEGKIWGTNCGFEYTHSFIGICPNCGKPVKYKGE